MSLLFALLALSAQATDPESEGYRAVGTAPLWNVRIGGGRMIFETPDRDIVSVETPAREPTEIGHAWSTGEFSVSVEYANCTDPLTRRLYNERAMVRIGDTHFEGCGGRVLSPAALPASYAAAGSEPFWWVEIADGRITYQIDDRVIIVAAPSPRSARDGSLRAYTTPTLAVTIRRQDCESDDDRTYADTVTVRARGRTVQGCGGRVLREATD